MIEERFLAHLFNKVEHFINSIMQFYKLDLNCNACEKYIFVLSTTNKVKCEARRTA